MFLKLLSNTVNIIIKLSNKMDPLNFIINYYWKCSSVKVNWLLWIRNSADTADNNGKMSHKHIWFEIQKDISLALFKRWSWGFLASIRILSFFSSSLPLIYCNYSLIKVYRFFLMTENTTKQRNEIPKIKKFMLKFSIISFLIPRLCIFFAKTLKRP